MSNSLRKEIDVLGKLKGIKKEYWDVIEIYKAYKRYKEKLGKPERYPLDPEKIMEDLSSNEFFKLIGSEKNERKNEARG